MSSRVSRHRRVIGGAVKDFMNKANQFLKKKPVVK